MSSACSGVPRDSSNVRANGSASSVARCVAVSARGLRVLRSVGRDMTQLIQNAKCKMQTITGGGFGVVFAATSTRLVAQPRHCLHSEFCILNYIDSLST